MRELSAMGLACVAACYAPEPIAGSPCVDDSNCPSALVCSPLSNTCERTRGGDNPTIDAPRVDGCTPTMEICGNGIDEDCDAMDPACAENDVPGGAVDITAGGMFDGDALLAKDDVLANGCGGDGGRDLFFRVTLNAPEVYYFDTFGSSYDTVIRAYAKPCASVGTGANAAACIDDACSGAQSQVAVSLPSGESCIVIDQSTGGEVTGNLDLQVVLGGRDGKPLAAGVQTNTGDTCDATSTIDPDNGCDGGEDGREEAFFFTTCPGETLNLDADICPEPSWDPVLHVRRVSGTQLGCDDDSCGFGPRLSDVSVTNSTLYFLYVDGFDAGECGPYSLNTNLRP